jgi:predicted dehydrogenase
MDGIRVGLLGYGAIGHEHNRAVRETDGLVLTAVCDQDPARIDAARLLAPDARGFADATAMLDSGEVDLVVVSTPPNSHHRWALEGLRRDLHVVLEKPMALTARECDEVMSLADDRGRTVVVYQNRRFDADFVALRAALQAGAIGDVFDLETFVGGFGRPCDFWHSDASVSGGAIFDWGSHFLDQILAVVPTSVAYVTGVNHKRRWHHATNADHAVATIAFDDGTRASFTHSDLAAARKPKYYVLGTSGAIVGDWDARAEPAVADLPAVLTLHGESGAVTDLDVVTPAPFAFHRQLAAWLRDGEPMEVTAAQSRDVVAIMEACEESARNDGRPVTPRLLLR